MNGMYIRIEIIKDLLDGGLFLLVFFLFIFSILLGEV